MKSSGLYPSGIGLTSDADGANKDCQCGFLVLHALTYRRFKLHKRRQLFIGADDEKLSVAMRVHNLVATAW